MNKINDQLCSRLAKALYDEDEQAVRDTLAGLEQVAAKDRNRAINGNIPDDTETLLHVAAREAHAEAAMRLIAWGADVNLADEEGNTPLANALAANRWKVSEAITLELIGSGAICNGYDRYDLTPLHHAAATGSKPVLRKLIAGGADVKALDRRDRNRTPLHEAAEDGNAKAVPLLIAAGAMPDQVTASGVTDLFLATEYGHRETAAELIRAGCNVNHTDPKGRTPLHFAARNGDADLIRDLVTAGADLHAHDDLGQSPLQILTAFDDIELLGNPVDITPPEPLDEATRLAIFITLVMQNYSGSKEFVESSFISILHEKQHWLVCRRQRLCDAVMGLAKNRSHESVVPRSVARICHDIFSYVIIAGASHRSVNDGFEIANLDDEAIDEEVDSFDLAFIRFFTGDQGFAADLTVEELVRQELEARGWSSEGG